MRMKKNKNLYEAPTIDILEVQLEGSVLTGSTLFGTIGSAGGDTFDEDYGGF